MSRRYLPRVALGVALAAALGAGIGIGVVIDRAEDQPRLSTPQISTPWRLVSKRERSRILQIEVQYGGCVLFDHVEVNETDKNVTLTAWSYDLAPDLAATATGPVSCTGELTLAYIPVLLKEPLGDRQLKGAAISGAWNGPRPRRTS